jgi:hypothetical protein
MVKEPEVQEEGSQFTSNPSLKRFHDSASLASWIFGGLILLFLMLVVFVDIHPSKFPIVRFLMALSAAFFALFFVGGVLLQGTLNGLYISATGGFVLFILVQFVFNPFGDKPTTTTDDTSGNTNTVIKSSTPSVSPTQELKSTHTPQPASPTPSVSSNNHTPQPASPIPSVSSNTEGVLRATSETVVAMMVAGDFSGVWERFSPEFKANLGPGDLRKGWENTVERAGPFQEQFTYGVVKDQSGNDKAVVGCKFEKGSADIYIYYDNKRQIIGLWYYPVYQ